MNFIFSFVLMKICNLPFIQWLLQNDLTNDTKAGITKVNNTVLQCTGTHVLKREIQHVVFVVWDFLWVFLSLVRNEYISGSLDVYSHLLLLDVSSKVPYSTVRHRRKKNAFETQRKPELIQEKVCVMPYM